MSLGSQSHQHGPYTFAASAPLRPWLRSGVLLLTGFVAVTLTFFAVFRVDLSGGAVISFRHKAVWQSTQTLRVTAPTQTSAAPIQGHSSRAAHRQTITSLTSLFTALANSSGVRDIALRDGRLNGYYEAETIDKVTGAPRGWRGPYTSIRARASSPIHAAQTAARVSRSFRAYVAHWQDEAQVPRFARARLAVMSSSPKATLVRDRRLTGPLAALGVVLALLALAGTTRWRAERR